jgi:hypothetical protein
MSEPRLIQDANNVISGVFHDTTLMKNESFPVARGEIQFDRFDGPVRPSDRKSEIRDNFRNEKFDIVGLTAGE